MIGPSALGITPNHRVCTRRGGGRCPSRTIPHMRMTNRNESSAERAGSMSANRVPCSMPLPDPPAPRDADRVPRSDDVRSGRRSRVAGSASLQGLAVHGTPRSPCREACNTGAVRWRGGSPRAPRGVRPAPRELQIVARARGGPPMCVRTALHRGPGTMPPGGQVRARSRGPQGRRTPGPEPRARGNALCIFGKKEKQGRTASPLEIPQSSRETVLVTRRRPRSSRRLAPPERWRPSSTSTPRAPS